MHRLSSVKHYWLDDDCSLVWFGVKYDKEYWRDGSMCTLVKTWSSQFHLSSHPLYLYAVREAKSVEIFFLSSYRAGLFCWSGRVKGLACAGVGTGTWASDGSALCIAGGFSQPLFTAGALRRRLTDLLHIQLHTTNATQHTQYREKIPRNTSVPMIIFFGSASSFFLLSFSKKKSTSAPELFLYLEKVFGTSGRNIPRRFFYPLTLNSLALGSGNMYMKPALLSVLPLFSLFSSSPLLEPRVK